MKYDDFPAAHSMDSGWFAVDEDGNLAHFAGLMDALDGLGLVFCG